MSYRHQGGDQGEEGDLSKKFRTRMMQSPSWRFDTKTGKPLEFPVTEYSETGWCQWQKLAQDQQVLADCHLPATHGGYCEKHYRMEHHHDDARGQ